MNGIITARVLGLAAIASTTVFATSAVALPSGAVRHAPLAGPGTMAHAQRVCRAVNRAGPPSRTRGPLAGLTAAQLTQLRIDCATLAATEASAAVSVRSAFMAEQAALHAAFVSVAAACSRTGPPPPTSSTTTSSTATSTATTTTTTTTSTTTSHPVVASLAAFNPAACAAARAAAGAAINAAVATFGQAVRNAQGQVAAVAQRVLTDLTAPPTPVPSAS